MGLRNKGKEFIVSSFKFQNSHHLFHQSIMIPFLDTVCYQFQLSLEWVLFPEFTVLSFDQFFERFGIFFIIDLLQPDLDDQVRNLPPA
jgi:hypothetical protein